MTDAQKPWHTSLSDILSWPFASLDDLTNDYDARISEQQSICRSRNEPGTSWAFTCPAIPRSEVALSNLAMGFDDTDDDTCRRGMPRPAHVRVSAESMFLAACPNGPDICQRDSGTARERGIILGDEDETR